MSRATRRATSARLLQAGALLVVVAIVIGAYLVFRPGGDREELTVSFDRTVSLYPGADVRILGVPVGEVESVTPMGETVQVDLWWDSSYDVPADAKAVIVSPAIVGDRYVQLTPAFDGGAVMESGTVLDASRSATPTELDEVYSSLDQLATALGPDGANRDGALDRLLRTTAKSFDGQGEKFNKTLSNFAKLTSTLDRNSDEIFGSVTELERFVSALAANDTAVRSFNTSLAGVAEVLSGERDDLATALSSLSGSLTEVQDYVRDNRGALRDDVDALVAVTRQLVDQRDNVAALLEAAPTTVANIGAAYNPELGTLDSRSNVQTSQALFDFNQSLDDGFVALGDPAGAGSVAAPCFLLFATDPVQAASCNTAATPLLRAALYTPIGGLPAVATRTAPSADTTFDGVTRPTADDPLDGLLTGSVTR